MSEYEPIHEAARHADVATLRRLLEDGVSPDALCPNSMTDCRKTALHLLCRPNVDNVINEGDRVACFELLRDAGANLEARTGEDPQGSTVLHYAANSGSPELLSLLLEAGVNVSAANKSGYTPLHWAALGDVRRSTELVELLLKAGAAVNAKTTPGGLNSEWTPFEVALNKGHRRMWPLFLRAGAEIPVPRPHPYLSRVHHAGGFKRYEQAHLARITAILAPTPLLPPELVRKILEFWLHAGFY